ncbi:PREDICTED: uncharacterized protein LOC107358073 isoform X1 [Acropora digitifera]|uniref:uncharacterized protein LOC107358073 isoform X1 n=1 Tax=Acropora digitifera TaxID=70779 RepID=UPI00077ABCCC|nr:PREDICTED: uncharacterized protein LOC107358073 isoform X1 [Acropora digitifera]
MEDSSHAQACIAAAVLVVILSLTALIFNSLQLIVLWKDPTKSFRSSTTVYIASLCIIQMCYGLIAGTAATESYLACAKGEEHSPHLESELSRLCFSFFVRTEGFLIVAFVTERFGSIVFPIFYQRGRYKAKNALFCVLCILIYSLCFSILDKIAGKFWVRSLDAHLNVIPFGAIVVLSALLDHRLRKRSVRQAENGCDISLRETPEESCRQSLTKQVPFAKAVVLIAVLFVASVIPYMICVLYEAHCSDCNAQELFLIVMRVSIALTFISVAASPFVYCVCIPDLREGFKILFYGKLQGENFILNRLRRNRWSASGSVPVIYL